MLGLRLAGVPVGTPWVQLLSLTPVLMLPSLAGRLLRFALARRRGPAAVASGVAHCPGGVCWSAPFAPRPDGEATGHAPMAGGPGMRRPPWLKAMSINAGLGQADAPASSTRLVRDHGIGLLTIQEHTQALEDRLTAEGLDRLLSHRVSDPTDDGAGQCRVLQLPP